MLVLAMRTDKSEAEIYVYADNKVIAEHKWLAHRQLSDTLNTEIDKLLKKAKISMSELNRLAVYQGPGSFTGLRIGLSVANAMGYSLDIPVVAVEGEGWLEKSLASKKNVFEPVVPIYGSEPNITKPRK